MPILHLLLLTLCLAYHRSPCTYSTRRQFQFEHCYVPNLNPNLKLSDASFVMSHNSATGYLNARRSGNNKENNISYVSPGTKTAMTNRVLSLYGKTQVGSAYNQLNNGARALDLRPKIYANNSIGFHHGDLIDVPLASIDLDIETEDGGSMYYGIDAMRQVYDTGDVPYYSCEELSNLTVAEAMDMSDLSRLGGVGYLLAVDRHDIYASFCGKANWLQDRLVTCYSTENYNQQSNTFIQCTDLKKYGQYKLTLLKSYTKASANNEPSDNAYELGPPSNTYWYPFNQIQAFWQVDTPSVQLGIMHGSLLLDNNRISRVSEEMVRMVYNQEFDSVSLLAIDNVALTGLALFSVLRNACGQSTVDTDEEVPPCGRELSMPRMSSSRTLPIFWHITLCIVYGTMLALVIAMMVYRLFD
ncbi:hypothetical protein ACHAXN_010296 [Cyclotella atomus]